LCLAARAFSRGSPDTGRNPGATRLADEKYCNAQDKSGMISMG
jgi:hypothetical protein